MDEYNKKFQTYYQNKSNKLNSNNKNFKIYEDLNEGVIEYKIKDKVEKFTIKFNHYHNIISFLDELYKLKSKQLIKLNMLLNQKIYSNFSKEQHNELNKIETLIKDSNELINFYYSIIYEFVKNTLIEENKQKENIQNKFNELSNITFDYKKNKQHNFKYFEEIKQANLLLYNYKHGINLDSNNIYSHLYKKTYFDFQNFIIIRNDYINIYNLIDEERKKNIKEYVEIDNNKSINNDTNNKESIKEETVNVESDKDSDNEESESDNEESESENEESESDKEESVKEESDKEGSDKEEILSDISDSESDDDSVSDVVVDDDKDASEKVNNNDKENKQNGGGVKTITLSSDSKHITRMFNKYKHKSDKKNRREKRDKIYNKEMKKYKGGEKMFSNHQLQMISNMLDNVINKNESY